MFAIRRTVIVKAKAAPPAAPPAATHSVQYIDMQGVKLPGVDTELIYKCSA